MKQRVKNVCFLTKNTINLKDLSELKNEVVALPRGAEILSVNLEIVEESDGGILADIGLNETQDFFSNDLDLSVKGNFNSSVVTEIKSDSKLSITLNNKATKGVIVIRVHYFLPSEIVAEY